MPGSDRGPLSAGPVDRARDYVEGRRTPVVPRDAATVVLLRPGADGTPEVYLLRRRTSMAFAGGMCVFPGGGVDERDVDAADLWAGPSAARWADLLGCDEPMARALVCAAVRETFEESGVLLAGPSATEVVADTTGSSWEADRRRLEGRELSMAEMLERRGLVLRSDLLRPYAAWTTPVFEPRRFATWFFAASLPQGQRTRDVSTESAEVMWLPAIEAVRRVDRGEVGMLAPTYLTCLDIAHAASPSDVLVAAEGRVLEMFTPQIEDAGGEYRLTAPDYYRRLLP